MLKNFLKDKAKIQNIEFSIIRLAKNYVKLRLKVLIYEFSVS